MGYDYRFTPVNSTSIEEIAYNAHSRTLAVRFRQGELYEYMGVPNALYLALLNAESLGGLFDRMVKQAGYEFRRIE